MKRLVLLALVLTPLGVLLARKQACQFGLDHGPQLRWERTSPVGFPSWDRAPRRPVSASTSRPEFVVVQGLPMATPKRAFEESRRVLDRHIQDWLAGIGVPRSWTPPRKLLDAMIEVEPVKAIDKEYGEEGKVYVQTLRLDRSERQRDRLLAAYEQDLSRHRLITLGGVLGFVLVCLGTVAGYIRADEATKGYYTRALRIAAAAGVGAAGVVLYQLLHACD